MGIMMPSLRFVLLDFVLVSFCSTSVHAAQSSSTTGSVIGVASFILQGLGYTTDSASTTVESISIPTAFDDKVASPLSSHYYANATASSNATSTVSNSGSVTASASAGGTTTSTKSSTTSTSTYIDTTTSSGLVNATIPSAPHSSYTTFTSLCTENGTLVTHTHSAPITSGGTTTSSVSVSAQASNGSSSSLSSTSVSAASNATRSLSSTGGGYASSNATTSSPFSGPTVTYANSSVSGYLNTTNVTATPASSTATGPQATVTTAGPWTVASNGSGYAYASRCNAEWSSYWTTSRTVNSPSLEEYATTYIITNYSAPLTTLCAGNTQINGPLVSTGTLELPWTLQSTIYNATVTLPPAPTCTVPSSQCSAVGVVPGWKYDIPPG
ncbi:hypothetical protein LTR33_008819, partial [Friedmanniomyces endolithicus]